MIELNDKQVRRQMVKRYLNAETSIEEEQQLADYYSTATEPLTEEDEEVWLLLQATTKGDSDFELSEEKTDEFDRLMVSGVPVRYRRRAIVGWISGVAASVALLFVLFGQHHEDKADEPQIAVVPQEEIKTEPVTEVTEVVGTHEASSVLCKQSVAERQAAVAASETNAHQSTRRKNKPLEAVKDNSEKTEREAANGETISAIMAAANVMGEQVETYDIQLVGDATIVTKTFVDGTSASCIVCSMDDGNGYSVIPL